MRIPRWSMTRGAGWSETARQTCHQRPRHQRPHLHRQDRRVLPRSASRYRRPHPQRHRLPVRPSAANSR